MEVCTWDDAGRDSFNQMVCFVIWFGERGVEYILASFDSVEDGSVSRFAPHTGFVDPTTPKGTPHRESIELRALVFYDDWREALFLNLHMYLIRDCSLPQFDIQYVLELHATWVMLLRLFFCWPSWERVHISTFLNMTSLRLYIPDHPPKVQLCSLYPNYILFPFSRHASLDGLRACSLHHIYNGIYGHSTASRR